LARLKSSRTANYVGLEKVVEVAVEVEHTQHTHRSLLNHKPFFDSDAPVSAIEHLELCVLLYRQG
jgi:hypothetical protein